MNIIFITGHRKSGTTMLHKLFDGHPELNVYPVDISLLYAYWPCHATRLGPEEAQERVNAVIRKSMMSIQGQRVSPGRTAHDTEDFLSYLWGIANIKDFNQPASIASAVAKAWCEYAGLDPSLPFVIKETSQAIHACSMIEAGLSARFVNLVRDPRDNYAAIKAGVAKYYSQMGEGEKEVLASVINRARMDMMIGDELDAAHPEWFTSVRFEDITNHSEDAMKSLAKFCGISFLPILTKPTVLGKEFTGNSHEGENFSGISGKNVGRWPERISNFEAGVIEFWLADVMQRWGYQRHFDKAVASQAFAEFYKWYNCRYFYYDSLPVHK